MRGWRYLRQHQVDVNILCTVHAANQDHPLELYRFFRDELQAEFIQFIPIIERATEITLTLADDGWRERPGSDRLTNSAMMMARIMDVGIVPAANQALLMRTFQKIGSSIIIS